MANILYLVFSKMPSSSFLYVDVENGRALHEKLKGAEILVPVQKTFYGATNFFFVSQGAM